MRLASAATAQSMVAKNVMIKTSSVMMAAVQPVRRNRGVAEAAEVLAPRSAATALLSAASNAMMGIVRQMMAAAAPALTKFHLPAATVPWNLPRSVIKAHSIAAPPPMPA